MAKIVGVHGIGQQLKGSAVIEAEWTPALRSGLQNAGCPDEGLPQSGDIRIAFYGDLFRQAGGHRSASAEIPYTEADIETGWEADFLRALYTETCTVEKAASDDAGLPDRSAPRALQNMLLRLCGSEFFGQIATTALIIGDLKQVYAYLHHDDIRQACRQRVLDALSSETRIVIAHSLGSVVAYEALCHQAHQVELLVTLGSPLGIPNLVLPYLDPRPEDSREGWPARARRWVNVSDDGDVVALAKKLSPLFGPVEDVRVSNEARAHDASPYLTARETGGFLAATLCPGVAHPDG